MGATSEIQDPAAAGREAGQNRHPVPRRRLAGAGAGAPAPTGALRRVSLTILMVVGAALVAGSGAIHLHLWFDGYRRIHTIGPLFMAQAIGAFVVALAILVTRGVIAAAAGAVLMLGTFGGLLISVNYGLFGFFDSLSAPYARSSMFVELAGAAVLLAAGTWRLLLLLHHRRSKRTRALSA